MGKCRCLMGSRTGIEWATSSWNPWQGCTKVSPGCKHCYMYRDKARYGQDPNVVVRSKDATFNAPLKWAEPRVIFTCSWSDWYHETADEWRAEAWEVIRRTPQHVYLILTKRADRMSVPWGLRGPSHGTKYPPPEWDHVWMGVSVESEKYVGRVDHLVQLPAMGHRFISAEPLLAPVSGLYWYMNRDLIDWVIAGGESGPGFRPMEDGWARVLRDQCQRAKVAFFLKQLGGWPQKRGGNEAQLDGVRWTERPRWRNRQGAPSL